MHNLRQLTNEINNHINSANVGLYDRPCATALLAASVVSRDLALPSAKVDNPKAHYRNAIQPAVFDSLNTINEAVPLCMDTAEDMIFRMWYTRYLLVHDHTNPVAKKLLCLVIAAGDSAMDNAMVEFLGKYPTLFHGAEFIVSAE